MGGGGATDAHEAEGRVEKIVEEFEADRAEGGVVLLENAVGAEAVVGSTGANGVEEKGDGWGDAAAVA